MAKHGHSGSVEDYLITEQVFRQVCGGEIATHDIEEILSRGYLIEEHRSSVRGDSLLFCAALGSGVRHLMRDAESSRPLILWTYQPKRPQWLTPARRAKQEEPVVDSEAGNCYFCGGPLKKIIAGNYDFRLDGQLYVIKKVPATLCEQCGEKYLSAEVAKNLERSVAEGAFSGVEQAQVTEYREYQGGEE